MVKDLYTTSSIQHQVSIPYNRRDDSIAIVVEVVCWTDTCLCLISLCSFCISFKGIYRLEGMCYSIDLDKSKIVRHSTLVLPLAYIPFSFPSPIS